MKQLNISQLRPHLGALNLILRDYGVAIVVECDDKTEEVKFEEGKKLPIYIAKSQDFTWVVE